MGCLPPLSVPGTHWGIILSDGLSRIEIGQTRTASGVEHVEWNFITIIIIITNNNNNSKREKGEVEGSCKQAPNRTTEPRYYAKQLTLHLLYESSDFDKNKGGVKLYVDDVSKEGRVDDLCPNGKWTLISTAFKGGKSALGSKL